MIVKNLIPWDCPEWDDYVAGHSASLVYHTSSWIEIVCSIGRYVPRCLGVFDSDRLCGVLPALEVRSRLTGNRLVTLPFSDECFALSDSRESLEVLLRAADEIRDQERLDFFEMRGAPAVAGPEMKRLWDVPANLGFSEASHFDSFILPLSTDTEAVYDGLHKKSVRPTIKRSARLGVTVRIGSSDEDINSFYRLYCLTRKKHGIPPQPVGLFKSILGSLTGDPKSTLYIAEYQGRSIGACIVLSFNGVTTLKYEVSDDTSLELRPVYAMLWRSIEDAARDGNRVYDFGRTEKDNHGLAGFKKRWGTQRLDLPYYYAPPSQGLSVVDPASLKYKLFTATFRHLPTAISRRIGERIFHHFG